MDDEVCFESRTAVCGVDGVYPKIEVETRNWSRLELVWSRPRWSVWVEIEVQQTMDVW